MTARSLTAALLLAGNKGCLSVVHSAGAGRSPQRSLWRSRAGELVKGEIHRDSYVDMYYDL